MADNVLETIPSFYRKVSEKRPFIAADTYEKHIVVQTTPSPITTKRRVFNRFLISYFTTWKRWRATKEVGYLLLHQSTRGCLYTLFKYRFSRKVIAKSGQVFDNEQRTNDFNHRIKEVDRMLGIAKKRLLRKKFNKHLFSSLQKTKTTQTSG